MDDDKNLSRIVTGPQPLDEEDKELLEEAYTRLDAWEREIRGYHEEAM